MGSTIAAAGEVVADGGLAVGIALGQDAVDAGAAEGAADVGVVGEGVESLALCVGTESGAS